MSYKKVYLKPGKEESLKRFHPWVFSGAIARVEGEPEEGEIVDVYTSKKEFIACGHFQIGSIAVRVLSFVHNLREGLRKMFPVLFHFQGRPIQGYRHNRIQCKCTFP